MGSDLNIEFVSQLEKGLMKNRIQRFGLAGVRGATVERLGKDLDSVKRYLRKG